MGVPLRVAPTRSHAGGNGRNLDPLQHAMALMRKTWWDRKLPSDGIATVKSRIARENVGIEHVQRRIVAVRIRITIP
jgi:hypothetical protein